MTAWQAELRRAFAEAAPRRRPVGDRRPLAEPEQAGLEYDILRILWAGPCAGSGIMDELGKEPGARCGPEVVYPTLQMLEDGDFVSGRCVAGKRVYTLAPKGSEFLANGREPERAGSSEASKDVPPVARGIRTFRGLRSALREIVRTRDPERYAQASAILERARLELLALLVRA